MAAMYVENSGLVVIFFFANQHEGPGTWSGLPCITPPNFSSGDRHDANSLHISLNTNILAPGVFLDVWNSFYNVNRNIVWVKLHERSSAGLRGEVLILLQSYLTGRKQYVSLRSVGSSVKGLGCEIPQVSILFKKLFVNGTHCVCRPSGAT